MTIHYEKSNKFKTKKQTKKTNPSELLIQIGQTQKNKKPKQIQKKLYDKNSNPLKHIQHDNISGGANNYYKNTKKIKIFSKEGTTIKFLDLETNKFDVKKKNHFDKLRKNIRNTIINLWFKKKTGAISNISYEIIKRLLRTHMFFARMKIEYTKLLKTIVILYGNNNSVIQIIYKIIQQIFVLQNIINNFEPLTKSKIDKSKKNKYNSILDIIKEQDKLRLQLMKYTQFNSTSDIGTGCSDDIMDIDSNKIELDIKKFKNKKILLCAFIRYRSREAIFNKYYYLFRDQYIKFLEAIPICSEDENKVDDSLKLVDIEIYKQNTKLTESKINTIAAINRCSLANVNKFVDKSITDAIEAEVESNKLSNEYKQKINNQKALEDQYVDQFRNFKELVKNFNDKLKTIKNTFLSAEYYGVHHYYGLPQKTSFFKTTNSNKLFAIPEKIDKLSKDPTFVDDFIKMIDKIKKLTIQNSSQAISSIFYPIDDKLTETVIPTIILYKDITIQDYYYSNATTISIKKDNTHENIHKKQVKIKSKKTNKKFKPILKETNKPFKQNNSSKKTQYNYTKKHQKEQQYKVNPNEPTLYDIPKQNNNINYIKTLDYKLYTKLTIFTLNAYELITTLEPENKKKLEEQITKNTIKSISNYPQSNDNKVNNPYHLDFNITISKSFKNYNKNIKNITNRYDNLPIIVCIQNVFYNDIINNDSEFNSKYLEGKYILTSYAKNSDEQSNIISIRCNAIYVNKQYINDDNVSIKKENIIPIDQTLYFKLNDLPNSMNYNNYIKSFATTNFKFNGTLKLSNEKSEKKTEKKSVQFSIININAAKSNNLNNSAKSNEKLMKKTRQKLMKKQNNASYHDQCGTDSFNKYNYDLIKKFIKKNIEIYNRFREIINSIIEKIQNTTDVSKIQNNIPNSTKTTKVSQEVKLLYNYYYKDISTGMDTTTEFKEKYLLFLDNVKQKLIDTETKINTDNQLENNKCLENTTQIETIKNLIDTVYFLNIFNAYNDNNDYKNIITKFTKIYKLIIIEKKTEKKTDSNNNSNNSSSSSSSNSKVAKIVYNITEQYETIKTDLDTIKTDLDTIKKDLVEKELSNSSGGARNTDNNDNGIIVVSTELVGSNPDDLYYLKEINEFSSKGIDGLRNVQLSNMIKKISEIMNRKPDIICGDLGFINDNNLKEELYIKDYTLDSKNTISILDTLVTKYMTIFKHDIIDLDKNNIKEQINKYYTNGDHIFNDYYTQDPPDYLQNKATFLNGMSYIYAIKNKKHSPVITHDNFLSNTYKDYYKKQSFDYDEIQNVPIEIHMFGKYLPICNSINIEPKSLVQQKVNKIEEIEPQKKTSDNKLNPIILYQRKEIIDLIGILNLLLSNFVIGQKAYIKRDFGCFSIDSESDKLSSSQSKYSLRKLPKLKYTKSLFKKPQLATNPSNVILDLKAFYSMNYPSFIEAYLFHQNNTFNVGVDNYNPTSTINSGITSTIYKKNYYYSENQLVLDFDDILTNDVNINNNNKIKLFKDLDTTDIDVAIRMCLIPSDHLKIISDIDVKNVTSSKDYKNLISLFIKNFYKKCVKTELEKRISVILSYPTNSAITLEANFTLLDKIKECDTDITDKTLQPGQKKLKNIKDPNLIKYLYEYILIMIKLKYIDYHIENDNLKNVLPNIIQTSKNEKCLIDSSIYFDESNDLYKLMLPTINNVKHITENNNTKELITLINQNYKELASRQPTTPEYYEKFKYILRTIFKKNNEQCKENLDSNLDNTKKFKLYSYNLSHILFTLMKKFHNLIYKDVDNVDNSDNLDKVVDNTNTEATILSYNKIIKSIHKNDKTKNNKIIDNINISIKKITDITLIINKIIPIINLHIETTKNKKTQLQKKITATAIEAAKKKISNVLEQQKETQEKIATIKEKLATISATTALIKNIIINELQQVINYDTIDTNITNIKKEITKLYTTSSPSPSSPPATTPALLPSPATTPALLPSPSPTSAGQHDKNIVIEQFRKIVQDLVQVTYSTYNVAQQNLLNKLYKVLIYDHNVSLINTNDGNNADVDAGDADVAAGDDGNNADVGDGDGDGNNADVDDGDGDVVGDDGDGGDVVADYKAKPSIFIYTDIDNDTDSKIIKIDNLASSTATTNTTITTNLIIHLTNSSINNTIEEYIKKKYDVTVLNIAEPENVADGIEKGETNLDAELCRTSIQLYNSLCWFADKDNNTYKYKARFNWAANNYYKGFIYTPNVTFVRNDSSVVKTQYNFHDKKYIASVISLRKPVQDNINADKINKILQYILYANKAAYLAAIKKNYDSFKYDDDNILETYTNEIELKKNRVLILDVCSLEDNIIELLCKELIKLVTIAQTIYNNVVFACNSNDSCLEKIKKEFTDKDRITLQEHPINKIVEYKDQTTVTLALHNSTQVSSVTISNAPRLIVK